MKKPESERIKKIFLQKLFLFTVLNINGMDALGYNLFLKATYLQLVIYELQCS